MRSCSPAEALCASTQEDWGQQSMPSLELWRKCGQSGAPPCSSYLFVSPMLWAWAMSGASPTCARCTVEVSACAVQHVSVTECFTSKIFTFLEYAQIIGLLDVTSKELTHSPAKKEGLGFASTCSASAVLTSLPNLKFQRFSVSSLSF